MKLIVVSEDFNSRLSGELSQLLSKHGGVLLLGNNIIEASYIDTPEYVITDIGAKVDNSFKIQFPWKYQKTAISLTKR